MLSRLEEYLLANWDQLPGGGARPGRLSFLGQATGVSKACFFAFADDEPSPRYIVKIPRSPFYNEGLMQEVRTIKRLRTTVSEDIRATLPGPMHVVRLSGHCVVVEPVIPGQPMDSLIRPDKPLDRSRTNVLMALAHGWLMQIQQEAPHRKGTLDAGMISEHILEPLSAASVSADLTTAEEDYIDYLRRIARTLEGQDMPLYLYHGDFRAGNILVDGGRVAVLDWEFSRPLAPPLLDWFSFVFRLYGRAKNLPDIDGSLEAYRSAFHQVFFARNWFSGMVTDYTRACCETLGVNMAFLPLLFGLFVVTNINKFHAFLTERAERGYLYLLRGAPTSNRPYQQQLRRQAYVWLLDDLAANADALSLRSLTEASVSSLSASDKG